MKRVIILLFLGITFSPLCTVAQEDRIDQFIVQQMKTQGIPGLSIGVVTNGKVVKAKGYGLANLELNVPASEKSIYKIGSVSKHFIAVAIMKLAEDHQLNLADPVSKFINGAPLSWEKITIRNLLNHNSGLMADPPGFDGMKEVPDSVYIKNSFKDSLLFSTGAKYEYSNFGYFLLADIIRIVSHLSFPEYMKKYVFDPAGLMSTRTTSSEALIPDRVNGYLKSKTGEMQNAAAWIALRPSGAFLSNIDDLLKWEMTMQAHQILSTRSWVQLWTDTIKTPMTMDGQTIRYGYGWMVNQVDGKEFLHHGGSLPGFKSVYFRYPEDKTAIIILTNYDDTDAYGIAFGVADLIKTGIQKK
ncbi:MAG TPA: serine hydrolase domain-containing protein [Mucilaginibacter sp.]|nr:serine hydrolase domain-containing protein [Mucilaginibacter sp.]